MSGLMLDASAVIAMLEGEPEAERIQMAVARAKPRWIGAVGALECAIVIEKRRGALGKAGLDALLTQLGVRTLAFDETQGIAAQTAYRRFGKGRHPASLNLGDCCAYAAAKALGMPLLQKGNDFPQTDLLVAPW